MNLALKTRNFRSSLAVSYLFVVFLTPWFHLHPGEDHNYVSGNSYHSHAEPFDSHRSEEDKDQEHHNSFPNHYVETNNLQNYCLIQAKIQSDLTQHCPQLETVLPDLSNASIHLKFSTPPKPLEWYVHFATNLSPPQA